MTERDPSDRDPVVDQPADRDADERNLGEQPLARVMREHDLRSQELVQASPVQITHKMVARAAKGRRLTANTMHKVVVALNAALGPQVPRYEARDLFDYEA